MTPQLALPGEEMARKANAIKTLSLGLLVAAVAGETTAVIIWLVARFDPIVPATLVAVLLMLTSLLAYWMTRAGKVKFAGYFFVTSFLLETAVITVLFGGATGPVSIIYIFPILAGGMVIGIRSGFLVATLAAVLYLAMIPVEQAGLLPSIITPGANGTVVPLFVAVCMIFFYLTAFLSWFAASRLNQALQDSHCYAIELQTANEKLRASEEELRAANEELRATEEELRASNEELEAANEELKGAQEQLIRSEKLAAIGQLAGGVGHELRNPLGAIKNAVYYVRGKVAKSELAQKEPRVLEFINIIDEEISSSNKIISDLLGFSRVGKPAVSPTRIDKVIEDALSRVAIPENIELTEKLDSGLSVVEIDPDQIQQVLVNMVTNAVQAMPEGGKLTVAARENAKFLDVEITDTGAGIPQESMARIFEPLFTTRAKGIGLGLAVSKSIIDRHGGQVEVKSKAGKGTTFNIKLPLKAT